jgi:hypothetical protein
LGVTVAEVAGEVSDGPKDDVSSSSISAVGSSAQILSSFGGSNSPSSQEERRCGDDCISSDEKTAGILVQMGVTDVYRCLTELYSLRDR